ncbi:MAG: preprotein translocase subunit SecE [Candidatus Saccharimonadales bacterium]
MATKKQTSSAKNTSKTASKTTVTRIKAVDAAVVKSPAKKQVATTVVKKQAGGNPLGRIGTPFIATGRYFKGAWYELGQVRWPTRRATWGLTGAVLAFSLFFVVLILLLDAGFKYLFDVILGK